MSAPATHFPAPPVLPPPRRRVAGQWLAISGMLGLACLVVYLFDPRRYGFYPRCPLHQFTGWACPGCGSLRAMHQLLHGRVWTAFQFNPLLVSVLPLLVWQITSRFHNDWRGLPPKELFPSPFWTWTAFAGVIGFAILRNLPFFPFPKV